MYICIYIFQYKKRDYLDKLFCSVIHFMIPLDVRDDAGHIDLTFERRRLARTNRHVVHDVLNVWLAAGPN